MKEKLQEYALIAEIISAICIVLSLIFVGLQVRQSAEETAFNTEAIRGQVRESMLNSDISQLAYFADYPYLISMEFHDGELTREEIGRMAGTSLVMIRQRENYWVQHENGILDDETFTAYFDVLLAAIETSDITRAIWNNIAASRLAVPAFVDFTNQRLAERMAKGEGLNEGGDWADGITLPPKQTAQ